jgi:hypothetical protein
MPSMGNSSTLGFFTEVPYYFALSPNYDFTLHPRYYSKYGMLWQGEWRHRLANGQYNIKVWGIDQEKEPASSIIEEGWRGSIQTRGQFSLSSWWRFGWDVTADSDISVWIGTKTNPFNNHQTLSDSFLSSLGFTEVNLTASTASWLMSRVFAHVRDLRGLEKMTAILDRAQKGQRLAKGLAVDGETEEAIRAQAHAENRALIDLFLSAVKEHVKDDDVRERIALSILTRLPEESALRDHEPGH